MEKDASNEKPCKPCGKCWGVYWLCRREKGQTVSKFKTAKRIIQEIKKGEWRPLFNFEEKTFLVASKHDDEIWIDGPFFCELSGETKERFGIIYRHWVWWAAARQLKHNALHTLGEINA